MAGWAHQIEVQRKLALRTPGHLSRYLDPEGLVMLDERPKLAIEEAEQVRPYRDVIRRLVEPVVASIFRGKNPDIPVGKMHLEPEVGCVARSKGTYALAVVRHEKDDKALLRWEPVGLALKRKGRSLGIVGDRWESLSGGRESLIDR